MTIANPITNYGQLVTALPELVNTTEAGYINNTPFFIRTAIRNIFDTPDFRINVLRSTIDVTIDVEGKIVKPSDYLQGIHIYFAQPDPTDQGANQVLYHTSFDLIQQGLDVGTPVAFADAGSHLVVAPRPSEPLTAQLDYFFQPANLVNDEDTNWLVENQAALILYRAAYEGEFYRNNPSRAAGWYKRFEEEMAAIIGRQSADTESGGTMIMRNADSLSAPFGRNAGIYRY